MRHDQQEEPDDFAGASADQAAMAASNQGEKLNELAGLVKSLIQSQAARDQQMDKDFSRQEQRWKSMQHQFQQIQMQIRAMMEEDLRGQMELEGEQPQEGSGKVDDPNERTTWMNVRPQREPPVCREPKLFPLSPEDDTEYFLTTFERMAQVCRWPKDEWAVHLVPLLTGKAQSAYVLMNIADCEDYEKVKAAILAKYEITFDTYCRRFRSWDIFQGETSCELYVRLKDLFSKWVKPEKSTVKEISEIIILEQFLRMVHPEMEVWIRERDPRTREEAAQLAEVFTAARKGTRYTAFGRDNHFAQRSPLGVNGVLVRLREKEVPQALTGFPPFELPYGCQPVLGGTCYSPAGLTINPKKCAIAQREVEHLEYVIGFGKIKPQVGKIEAIQATTKRKLLLMGFFCPVFGMQGCNTEADFSKRAVSDLLDGVERIDSQ
ncbi:hypothetical protein L3Q82_024002, partial [Scortum barcoo]